MPLSRASRVPLATYRLQLNRDLTFGDAEALIPYFVALGVDTLYLSPILMAARGPFAGSVVAFARVLEREAAVVLVPRLSSRVGPMPVGTAWRDTEVGLPSSGTMHNVLTGASLAHDGAIQLSDAMAELPLAVLYARDFTLS
ncbi:MAG: hypothetical protein ABI051_00975 [Vicinamibacterales bacterium]